MTGLESGSLSSVRETKQAERQSSGSRVSPLAGRPASREMLVNLERLEKEYFDRKPDRKCQPFRCVWDKRPPWNVFKRHVRRSARSRHYAGHLRLPADARHGRSRQVGLSDGVVITPSHNPPEDGGFKYNSPNGGPGGTGATGWIQDRANNLLRARNREVKRIPYEKAIKASSTHLQDLVLPYVKDLKNVVDMNSIRDAGLRLAVDPLGGAALGYWEPINAIYRLDITIVNSAIDSTFSFMPLDHDGRIRMDCSSPYAMAGPVSLKDRYQVAFANDPDSDRHGIVTPTSGLMSPNHFLAVAIHYLLTNRPE
jgi:phosphoglucomutase